MPEWDDPELHAALLYNIGIRDPWRATLQPPFTTLQEIPAIDACALLYYGSSTTGLSCVEVLKALTLHFFNARMVVRFPKPTSKNPRLPNDLMGLKAIFSSRLWAKAREDGTALEDEHASNANTGSFQTGGQVRFCKRLLAEWLRVSTHPDAPLLLSIVSDGAFVAHVEQLRVQMDRLTKRQSPAYKRKKLV